jgi:4-amino-4-deoxy-L-arabinose transferase-like glycosyltransferase
MVAARRSWGQAWLPVLVFAQLGVLAFFARFALIDDAFIAFRYAEHFAQGHGLVFNLGERVEGYTCFLWVMLLSLPALLGLDLVVASKIFGALFAVLTLVVTARFFSGDPAASPRIRWLAPGLLVGNAAVGMWAVHGLETALFALLLTLALRADAGGGDGQSSRVGIAGVWYGLASLTRPEGLIAFFASLVFRVVAGGGALKDRKIVQHALVYAVIVLPHFVWRYFYYGYPLPNTYYAKVALSWPLVVRGGEYVLGFFGGFGALLFLALPLALWAARRDRKIALLACVTGALLCGVILEGGDGFPGYRFLIPIAPALYLLVQAGVEELIRFSRQAGRRRLFARAVFLIVALGVPLHAHRMFGSAVEEARGADKFTRRLTFVGHALRALLPSDTRIALNPVGAVPYYSGLYTIDMLGLTDEHIAHTDVTMQARGYAGHEKGDGEYILDRAPDVILLGNVQVAPRGPVNPRRIQWPLLGISEHEIGRSPRTQRLYVPDQLRLPDGRYLLFLRRTDFRISAR